MEHKDAYYANSQPADILEGLLEHNGSKTSPTERRALTEVHIRFQKQAYAIFDLVRRMDQYDSGLEDHLLFEDELNFELAKFNSLRREVQEVRVLHNVQPVALAPVPIRMVPKRKFGVSRVTFVQTMNSGTLALPSEVNAVALESVNGQCSICARDYSDSFTDFYNGNLVCVLSACKHVFHFDCLLEWFKHKNTCPLCRVDCYY